MFQIVAGVVFYVVTAISCTLFLIVTKAALSSPLASLSAVDSLLCVSGALAEEMITPVAAITFCQSPTINFS